MDTPRVDIYRAESYESGRIKEILRNYFSREDFYAKKVLLKPNMLQAHRPDENVTTHPSLVKAAAEVVMEYGGTCAIGDSPSGWGIKNAREAAEKSGMLEVAGCLGIKFEVFDGRPTRPVKIEGGTVYREINLPENYLKYETVVNIPKLKTHGLTVFTLGVKNMMGVVPGLAKSVFHKKATHPEKFACAIADLYSVVRPDYTVLDAIEAMEGDGPVNGRTKKLNRIFCSSETNALDAAVEKMCGVDPLSVPITREVYERGLGKINNIDIIKHYEEHDEEFEGFRTPLIPRLGRFIPRFVLEVFSPLLDRYPQVNRQRCVYCRKCAEVCPADAVSFPARLPVFDLKKCVRCFCCGERCPESAITEKKKLLASVFD